MMHPCAHGLSLKANASMLVVAIKKQRRERQSGRVSAAQDCLDEVQRE